jgi:hypothetical protein
MYFKDRLDFLHRDWISSVFGFFQAVDGFDTHAGFAGQFSL